METGLSFTLDLLRENSNRLSASSKTQSRMTFKSSARSLKQSKLKEKTTRLETGLMQFKQLMMKKNLNLLLFLLQEEKVPLQFMMMLNYSAQMSFMFQLKLFWLILLEEQSLWETFSKTSWFKFVPNLAANLGVLRDYPWWINQQW